MKNPAHLINSRNRCFLIAAVVAAALPLAAQYTTATLGGTVVDASGANVPEADVTIRNVATDFSQTVRSDASGSFLFSRLPVGSYQLSVEKPGFSTYVQSGIELTVNQVANQNVTLQVGQVSERVTVEATADLVTTRTATAGQLIDTKRVVDLPLNGRGAQTLVFLAAGTVNLTSRYCGVDCHGGVYPGEQVAGVNGAGSGQVNYQLDATDHNDSYINMNLPFPNPDALQEFNLQSSNFTAEYGNAGGGVVNIVTRSGTNEFHGSAFEFLRNGRLNARNFFAPTSDTLKRNQFGVALGGPIVKSKLFFFGTYQGTIVRSAPAGRITFVPTAAERRGDFSGLTTPIIDPLTKQPFPNNQIPAGRLSQPAQYFLDRIPLPNGEDRQLTFGGAPTNYDDYQFMPKIDWYVTERQQLSGRYFFTDFNRPAIPDAENVLRSTGGNAVRVQNISLIHTYTLSPTLILNSTFGLNRQRGGSLAGAPFSFRDAGVNIAGPQDSLLAAPPSLNVSITGGFGIGTNHDGAFDRGSWTVREVVTKVAGAHELRFGGEAIRLANEINNTFQMMGNFNFSGQIAGDGMADFMLGEATRFTQGGGEFKDLKGTKWSLFLQDNWRVTQDLTLNLGVRWDPYLPYYDRQGRAVCFQPGQQSLRYPNAPVGLIYGGENHDPGCPVAGSENNWWNIGPRIGFAYRLTQDSKTSLRGGIGQYYTPPQTSQFNPFTNIAPFAPTFIFNGVSFEDPYKSAGVANPFPEQYGPTVRGPEATFTTPAAIRAYFTKDWRIPVLTTWNLILERQIGSTWVARAGYYGNKGTHLSFNGPFREVNPAIYIPGASTVANTQSRRVYQDFSNVGLVESSNNSHYNSLQLNLEKRFAQGLSILANYTWQKTIDDFGWVHPFNRRYDYAVANDDVTHVLKFSNIYEFPRANLNGFAGRLLNGWSVNSIVLWQSGFPLSIGSGLDNSFTGVGRDRADFLGGEAQLSYDRPHGEMIAMWFDTSRFTVNAPGTFGNSGRNNLRGPRFFNTDFSVIKDTRIRESASLQFRAEFFNLFNNVNFSGPSTNRSSAQFGRITLAGDPRILQFALKVQF
ncbi:MAG: TonB-dependent receptor domain-containing protein [Bryobacteraceae bacterium]